MNTKQTFERLQPVINSMDKSIICQSVVDNGNGTYTFACNRTKWAIKGYPVSIGGNDYQITNVSYNDSITVSGTILPVVLTFDLYAPFFKHGTIKTVAKELTEKKSYKDKLPLIFLHETVQENVHFNTEDALDYESDCRIYFLTDCNYSDWTQIDGDTLAIKPMRALCNEFIKALAQSQYVAELETVGQVLNHNIFGTYDSNGITKNIFNEYLSGVQLRISIPFQKECECCDIADLDNRPAPAYVLDPSGNVLAILYSNEIYVATGIGCEDVTIKDQDGNTLTTVASGGDYTVTVLTTIKDTIINNVTTITDNII